MFEQTQQTVAWQDNDISPFLAEAESLVAETHAHDGLAPLDLDRFWADQAMAAADPFGRSIPQVPIGRLATDECVFAELGVAEDWDRYYHDRPWMSELCSAYNDKAERIIGRRPLNDQVPDPGLQYPQWRQLHDIFEAKNVFHHESYWLKQVAETPDELAGLLDRVDRRLADLRSFVLPENWSSEKQRLESLGIAPPLYRHQRGPVTFATSIFGVENLLFLFYDQPKLVDRLSDTILRAMLALAELMDCEAGPAVAGSRPGFSFADDNCYLLTPEMYEQFAYPILKGMFDRYAPLADPTPGQFRFQHSDSDMGHLLPLLGRLELTGTNFGPTLSVSQIRHYLPNALIHGQLAPFTYSRNQEVQIVAETMRDCAQARPARGLELATAGSVNNGSRLSGLRLIMATIQRYGRYD